MQSTDHEMPLKGLTALIADDLDFVRDALERALTRFGAQVHHARDGLEAVDRFVTIRPDVVLIDGAMPRMSGAEAVSRIRSTEGGEQVVIIALSGDDGASDDRQVDMQLSKPISANDLLAAVQSAIATRGLVP